MNIREFATDYIAPTFVAIMASNSFHLETLLIDIISPFNLALDGVIHICTAVSALLGVIYLFVKIYLLLTEKKKTK